LSNQTEAPTGSLLNKTALKRNTRLKRFFYFFAFAMKDYYQVLGLPRAVNASQLRAAYRRLVQQYHPDVNPDPAAHELIKDINEAYAVLSDDARRREYDHLLDNPFSAIEVTPPPHRDPAYRRTPNYRAPKRESAQVELMRKYLPWAFKIAYIGCITCGLLLIDFVWPRQRTVTEVKFFENRQFGRTSTNYIVTESGRHFKISDDDWRTIKTGQRIEIVESGLFAVLVEINIPELTKSLTNLGTIYRNFLFAPWLLLLLSVLGLLAKGSVEFRFNLGIVTVFVLIFTWIITLN
jgi:hypothetical protein